MAGPSTRAVGDAFEAYALRYLNHHLKMSLRNVGGRGDGGIDLRGDWWLPHPLRSNWIEPFHEHNSQPKPSQPPPTHVGMWREVAKAANATMQKKKLEALRTSDIGSKAGSGANVNEVYRQYQDQTTAKLLEQLRLGAPGLTDNGLPDPDLIAPLRIVVQCKAEANKIGPRHVRELNGVLLHIAGQHAHPTAANEHHHPAEPAPHIGIHVSQSGFTPGAMTAANACTEPLMLVHLDGGRVGDGPGAAKKSGVRSLWYNASFGGLLNDRRLEIRQLQRPPPAAFGVGLYYAGERMERFGPPLE